MSDRCTCPYGRDTDGSEFGPCEYCEAVSEGRTDEDVQAIAEPFGPSFELES